MTTALLDGQLVPEDAIDPARHRFIGTFRPPSPPDGHLPDGRRVDVIVCTCGRSLWDLNIVREHWLAGHFDEPQYQTIS